ncbi:outer membrane protein [Rubritalea sp.]|uniref:outer membrane protein n=1 Tax=Rubritalea sp. TaxID=2109375 RepID=UPI003EF81595
MKPATIARLIPAAICLAPFVASAGTPAVELIIVAPEVSPWEFRVEPYGWLTGINGVTGPERFTTDVDAGFADIADVLKMAAALQVEARHERWGFLAEGFYANLGNSGHTNGPERANVDLGFKQFLGTFKALYRFSETPTYFVDAYAGVRYNNLQLDIDVDARRDLSTTADKDWADPIIGLRGHWNLNDKWFLTGEGDIGGFGVSSDFTLDLEATVGYNFTPNINAELGYRYFSTDYDTDGFIYDVDQAGLLIGLNFMF